MECQDGCVMVEKIIKDEVTEHDHNRWMIIDNNDKLKKYKCFQDIKDYKHGHPNYAVMSYAVQHGHLDCLKKLHKEIDADWHAGLAEIAAEYNRMDCLKYIMENMGRVHCREHILKCSVSLECKEYITNICKNCKGGNKQHYLAGSAKWYDKIMD